jgi:hypothetical protein
MTVRLNLEAKCNTSLGEIVVNKYHSRNYPRVTWGLLRYPMCAVVGGGESLKDNLNILRTWPGHIYGVNDTAAYLSEHGIASTIYSIDCTPIPYRKGKKIKGALFASRCHKNQFTYKNIRVFDMVEDDKEGVGGGVSGVGRSIHLFLRMGYRGITYFGCDSSFTGATHLSGTQNIAFENMIIVRAGNKEYLTNAAMILQAQYMVDCFIKYPQFLVNASGGLMQGMLENPDTWEVVAVAEDLKNQYESLGCHEWNKPYKVEEVTWQTQQQQ